jgi:hypothetical protein
MTQTEQDYLSGLAAQTAALVIAGLKDEGLIRDDRPLLSLEEAATRLGVSRRVIGDMTKGVEGKPPVLATVKVGASDDSHKGVKVEPAEIDRYLETQRRLALTGQR